MTSTNLSHKEETALQAYVRALDERFGPRLLEVLLFGSKARNEARPDSDIDVAVILYQPSAQDLSEVRGLTFDIWLAHGVSISVRAMSRQGWERLGALRSLFYRNLKRDGVSLLSRAA
jgi:predicted nucleotidyltransferase